jgi:ABC-2 type transport system permease protein
MSKVYPVIWKEIKDMFRDLRTLALISLLPLIMMPAMSLSSIYLQQYQPSIVILRDEDNSTGNIGSYSVSSIDVINYIASRLRSKGYIVIVDEITESFDLEVVIPKGFVNNLTSLDRKAYIKIIRVVGSTKAIDAENLVKAIIDELSRQVAEAKVFYLSELANVSIITDVILNPVDVLAGIISPGGEVATPAEDIRVQLARILTFSLLFVTTPSIAYITDSIIGEKERKTFEALLSTPIPRYALLVGKLFSSSIVGLVASIGDISGLILFFALPSLAYGVNILSLMSADLIAIHGIAVYLSVLASLAIIMPIMIRSGSYRASQAASFALISITSIVFFASLYVDIPNLEPFIRYPLYLLPYTHVVAMIRYIVLGNILTGLMHFSIALIESFILILIAVKLFSDEKIIYSKT